MKRIIGPVLVALAMAQFARADSNVQQAQEELKKQGFYFGQINGEKNADTIAAIRRFQIRSGLAVTGELNEETLRALRNGSSSSGVTTPTAGPQAPEDSGNTAEPSTPAPPPRNRETDGVPVERPQAPVGVFRGTPYEIAPPELQRQVILGAQIVLRRRGFYKGETDGVYGRNLEFSVRAFQSRLGIAPNGRLDMDTLAALGLLPGQHGRTPLEMPHLRGRPRDEDQPPVRGEWIH
jgi:peptidoglycan hydrolase-like protein with peptidoglycan-binding domain